MKLPSAILVLVLVLPSVSRLSAAEPAPAAAAPAPAAVPPTPAATSPATNGSSKIVFAERDFDFGKVIAGQTVAHDFFFTNTGDALLVITGVTPGCGCTTAGAYSSEVAPGRSGVIPIHLDTSRFSGPQAKNVTVMCNDRSQGVVNLILKGTIVIPIEVSPPFVALNVVPDSPSNATAVVMIHNNTGSPVTLENPVSNQPGIAGELKVLKPGQDFELTVHTVAQLITNNAFAAVTLKTSCPTLPVLTVSAVANFLPPVSLMPAQIVIMQPGQSVGTNTYRFTIVNNSVKPLSVFEPVVNIFGAKAAVEETQPGKQFSVNLTLPPGFEIPPGTNYEIRVKTSNPQYAQVRVPIRQITRAISPGMQPGAAGGGLIRSNTAPRPMPPQPMAVQPVPPAIPTAASAASK